MTVLHEGFRKALSPEVRSHGDCTHMSVPVLDLIVALVTLNFSDKIALDVANSVFTNDAVLAPLVQILSIEICVERLCQKVHVDVIVL